MDFLTNFNSLTEEQKAGLKTAMHKLEYFQEFYPDFPTEFSDLATLDDKQLYMECINELKKRDPRLVQNIEAKKLEELNDNEIKLLKFTNKLPNSYSKGDKIMDLSETFEKFVGEGKLIDFTKTNKEPRMDRSVFKTNDEVMSLVFVSLDQQSFTKHEVVNESHDVALYSEKDIDNCHEFMDDYYNIFAIRSNRMTHFGAKESKTFGSLIYESILIYRDKLFETLKDKRLLEGVATLRNFKMDFKLEAELTSKLRYNIGLTEEEKVYQKSRDLGRFIGYEGYDRREMRQVLAQYCESHKEIINDLKLYVNLMRLLRFHVASGYNTFWIDLHLFAFQCCHVCYLIFERFPSTNDKNNIRTILPTSLVNINPEAAKVLPTFVAVAQFFSNVDMFSGKKQAFLDFPIDTYAIHIQSKITSIMPFSRLFSCFRYLITYTDELTPQKLVEDFKFSKSDVYLLTYMYNAYQYGELQYLFNYHRHCYYRDPKHFNLSAMMAFVIMKILGRGNNISLFRQNFQAFCDLYSFANFDNLTAISTVFNDIEANTIYYIGNSEKITVNDTQDIFDIPNFISAMIGWNCDTLSSVKRFKLNCPVGTARKLCNALGLFVGDIEKSLKDWNKKKEEDELEYNRLKEEHNRQFTAALEAHNYDNCEKEYKAVLEVLTETPFDKLKFDKLKVSDIMEMRSDHEIPDSFKLLDLDDFDAPPSDDDDDENDGDNNKIHPQKAFFKDFSVSNGILYDPDGFEYYDQNLNLVYCDDNFMRNNADGFSLGEWVPVIEKAARTIQGYLTNSYGIIMRHNDKNPIVVNQFGLLLDLRLQLIKINGKPFRVVPYTLYKLDDRRPYNISPGDIENAPLVDDDGFVIGDDGKNVNSDSYGFKRFVHDYVEIPKDYYNKALAPPSL